MLRFPAFSADKKFSFGRFKGSVQTEWLSDGRHMKLLTDFAYIDPDEREWLAPKGAQIDGASIPRT
jgi:hypothetical protein